MTSPQRYWRRVIQIKAEDSPNVKLGLREEAAGLEPSHTELVPGVLTYNDYKKRRASWDKIRQCISLDAEFYEGGEVKMFPPLWINRAVTLARQMRLAGVFRKAKTIGVDPGEGESDTSWAVVDELGLIELQSQSTPDTNVIIGITQALMKKYSVPAENVCFDRGGGGKQHADRMRAQGYRVRTVAFGEPMLQPIKYGLTQVKDRITNREEMYSYVNRRAEMFGTVRQLIDPINKGFAIPGEYVRLRREMMAIPLKYDEEGRLFLLPKNRKNPEAKVKGIPTLIELIGHSPNDLDALAVAVFAMTHPGAMARAGAS